MQLENNKSFENEYNNSIKSDLLLSQVSYLRNKHHNLARAFYSLNNCFRYFLDTHDPDFDSFSINNDSFSDNRYNSASDIFQEGNNKDLSFEEIAFLKKSKNLNKEKLVNVGISSKETKIKPNRTKYFSVIYPKKDFLGKKRNLERDSSPKEKKVENQSPKNEKKTKKRRRRERRDMIRRMIVRTFLNKYIVNKLNKNLKRIKSKLYFEKFEKDFAYDLAKKKNKILLNKTLEDIFTSIELYRGEKSDKFHHNKQEIEKLKSEEYKDILKETKIDIILNSSIYILYKEYLSSNEYEREIYRLENSQKNYEQDYMAKYKNEATNFIEYSNEWILKKYNYKFGNIL